MRDCLTYPLRLFLVYLKHFRFYYPVVQNVWFSNGLSNHMIKPFENRTKKCPKCKIFIFQVFIIQMVTVYLFLVLTEPWLFISGLKKFERHKEEEEEVILHGTDWESVNYTLDKLACSEEEITGTLEHHSKMRVVSIWVL